VEYGASERALGPGQDAEAIAKTMLRARAPKSNFSRPIKMPPMGIAYGSHTGAATNQRLFVAPCSLPVHRLLSLAIG
jgi:hypothetical protein